MDPIDNAFTGALRAGAEEATFSGALSFMRRRYSKDLAGVDVADQAGRHLDRARLQRHPELLDEQHPVLGRDRDDDRRQAAGMGALGVFPGAADHHALVAAFVDDAGGVAGLYACGVGRGVSIVAHASMLSRKR